MAQYVFTMNGVGKVVPPKKVILEDISLNFFPGAKIGVLGYNGSGKSTLLRIMAGIDTDYIGEARPAADLRIGYLQQEPQLDESKDVRGNVEEGLSEIINRQNLRTSFKLPMHIILRTNLRLQLTLYVCHHGTQT